MGITTWDKCRETKGISIQTSNNNKETSNNKTITNKTILKVI